MAERPGFFAWVRSRLNGTPAPSSGDGFGDTVGSVAKNAAAVSLWASSDPVYEPPPGMEPWDGTADGEIPWELRDERS